MPTSPSSSSGSTPGKDFPRDRLRQCKQGVGWIKSGLWYGAGAYYPTSISKLSVKTLIDALNGKEVPRTINILHQAGDPLIIDAAFLRHPTFKADWTL